MVSYFKKNDSLGLSFNALLNAITVKHKTFINLLTDRRYRQPFCFIYEVVIINIFVDTGKGYQSLFRSQRDGEDSINDQKR